MALLFINYKVSYESSCSINSSVDGQSQHLLDTNYDGRLEQENVINDKLVKMSDNSSNRKIVLSTLVPNLAISRTLYTSTEVIKYPEIRSIFNNFNFFNYKLNSSSKDELEVEIKDVKKVN